MAGRARSVRSASAPQEAAGASRTSSSTAMPTATRMTAATWKGRFQVDGSLCFHEVMTVALMVQTGQGAEHRGEQEGLDPAAAAEHLGHHGHVGQGEDGGGLSGDQDHQHQQPVAAGPR